MRARLSLLALALVALAALYLLFGLSGRIWFILELRSVKLASLLVVGAGTGIATVLFQTISANRILTPGILGFDSLFMFLQTLLVMVLGGFGYATLGQMPKFLSETALMTAAAVALFGLLLGRGPRDLARMLLVGVVIGALFRSASALMVRLMDPSEFAMVQGAMFASFGAVNRTALAITAVLSALAALAAMRLAPQFDVMTLGRKRAVGLGLAYDRLVLMALALTAVLTAAATALVGPIAFLGLIAVTMAHAAVPAARHAVLIPAAAITGASILIAGQFLFERLLGLQSSLAAVIEFGGGLIFLVLVLKGKVR